MKCEQCQGERYMLQGCCSGIECGCMGMPVSVTNCTECNPEGTAEMSKELEARADYLEYTGIRPPT